MKLNVKTLDNVTRTVKITHNELSVRSELHIKARNLLKQLFPFLIILEEVYIPIFKNQKLPFDFFIPMNNTFIEVQGEQHFKYTPYFHKSKYHFIQAKTRDANKKSWCDLNNFKLVELLWNEDIDTWTNKIYGH